MSNKARTFSSNRRFPEQRHVAVFVALAVLDMHGHALAVDVRDFEGAAFAQTQAAGIDGEQANAVALGAYAGRWVSKGKAMKRSFLNTFIVKLKFNLCTILIVTVTIVGCAAFGTKTLYRMNTKSNLQITTIGFLSPELDSSAVVIFPETSEVMTYTVLEGAEGTNNFIFKLIDDSLKINFFKPNTNLIKSTCVLYGVDGIIIANLKFIHVTYSVYFVPIAQNFDTEVELKLFDKYGNLVIQTLHNTYKGNSYMMPPDAETTVRDGVRGALRRLVKELQKLQSDQQ